MNTLAPSIGKAADLRAHLQSDVRRLEANGLRQALLVVIAGPGTGEFARVTLFESLAAVDARRAAVTPGGREAVQKRDLLISRPVSTDLLEVLLAFPA